jgi:hypothetical protein
MLDICCDGQSALDRAFRSAHMDISAAFLTHDIDQKTLDKQGSDFGEAIC